MILKKQYGPAPDGLGGNDDCGQMSAWYVLAASGIHPICPGDTRYEITSPVFSRVDIRTAGGVFSVIARNNSPENIYIQSAMLNGKPYPYCHIDHGQIMAGGTLELVMGPKPNTEEVQTLLKPPMVTAASEVLSTATSDAAQPVGNGESSTMYWRSMPGVVPRRGTPR